MEKYRVAGFSFRSALGLDGMFAVLMETGLSWQIRDSTWHGDYLSCRTGDGQRTKYRIFKHERDDGFTLDVIHEPTLEDNETEWAKILEKAKNEVLSRLSATSVMESGYYD